MPGIILQTNAVKIVNRGGGFPTKMFREEIEFGILRIKKKITRRMVSTKHLPGTDYVVFVCPAPDCGNRNRRSVYEAKAQTKDGRLSFKCNRCYREIEVQRPMSNILSAKPQPQAAPAAGPPVRPGVILGLNGLPMKG